MDRTNNDSAELAVVIVSDRLRVNGALVLLTLSADGLLRWARRSLSIAGEVLGFTVDGPRIRISTAVDGGGGVCCFPGRGVPVRREIVLEPMTEDSKTLWCSKLREFIDSLGRPKRLVVFLNPYGGKKYASKIYLNDVKPFLEDANVEITLQETKHQLHAKQIAQSMDISKFDGIVCVSGDGILVEVVNGLLEREDWAAAIKMPLGLVPAGTGNGMVKSLLDSVGEPCTPANAILAIIRGHKRPLDVATIVQGQTRFFSVLMLAWGLVADIDIESEKYRWMGSARMDFYGLQRILHLREYNGSISFVPAPGYEAYGEPTSYKGECSPHEEQSVKAHQRGYPGPNVNLENLEWRTINGPFVSVWLHNVPWASEDTMAAPDAKFSDGCLDLIIIKDCPRLSLLALMTKMSDGGHVRSPHAIYLKVKAFWLEPGARVSEPSKEGIIDSDGEVLARGKGTYGCEQKAPFCYGKLGITVDQGMVTLFSPVQG